MFSNSPEGPDDARRVAVVSDERCPLSVVRARQLSEQLGLALMEPSDRTFPLHLIVRGDGLHLQSSNPRRLGRVRIDFTRGGLAYRRRSGGGGQLIARAIDLRGDPPTIVDATAGFGTDAFLLASLGCAVVAIERCPVIAALLDDALTRGLAEGRPSLRRVLQRIRLIRGDARTLLTRDAIPSSARDEEPLHLPRAESAPLPPLRTLELAPGVVYLDPMYAPRRKQKALSRKEMRICRLVVGDDTDATETLAAARAVAQRRVVVKRHRGVPPLAPAPDIQYHGPSLRYDVYFPETP
jgi:16S rRNA (guanine1516-N2)-methyltransferase